MHTKIMYQEINLRQLTVKKISDRYQFHDQLKSLLVIMSI